MDEANAVRALAALAHTHRLAIFRALIQAGPTGMAAGEVARMVGIGATTLSFHMKELDRAGLVRSWRVGRFVRSSVEVEAVRRLFGFLVDDCCQGRPELCGDGLQAIAAVCCGDEEDGKSSGLRRGEFKMSDKIYNVLFLCTHNSARSVIGECIVNALGQGKFRGFSAGSHPRGTPNPYALEMLQRLNYDTSVLRSKSWDEFAAAGAPQLDFVFTVCDDAANEACPHWPGQPMTAHWGLPDPSAIVGNEAEKRAAFTETHRMLYQRISIFVNLPLESLDKLTLQKRLDEMGQRADAG